MKIIFAGTPDFAVSPLQALIQSKHEIAAVYTQPDRPAGRGQRMHCSPVKELALLHNIPVFQPATLRDPEQQKILHDLQADLMIVAAYGLLLPKAVLAAPHFGCINIHASLLPRWRGAAPIQRAILAGDQETGITIMQMDEGLDTGAMLLRVSCPIHNTDNSQNLLERLAAIGTPALLDVLQQLESGQIQSAIQNETLATYAKKISKEEALIDWCKSAIELDRAIRAFNPWPVMHTTIQGQTLKIWQARIVSTENISVNAGTILNADKHGIDVATGRGILRLVEIQLPGGRRLAVSDVLNSRTNLFIKNTLLGE